MNFYVKSSSDFSSSDISKGVKPTQAGVRGQKIPIFAGCPKWMTPNMLTLAGTRINTLSYLSEGIGEVLNILHFSAPCSLEITATPSRKKSNRFMVPPSKFYILIVDDFKIKKSLSVIR